jgi:hypothetical protein
LPQLLASLIDSRRDPDIPTFDVVNSLLHTALLRIPSFNALEGDLRESDFQKLIGRTPTSGVKAFSADVVANVLDKLSLSSVRRALEEVIAKAERNNATELWRPSHPTFMHRRSLPFPPAEEGQTANEKASYDCYNGGNGECFFSFQSAPV